MVNENIKKEVDELLKIYSDEAFSNINDSIEQITLLLCLKYIDKKELDREKECRFLKIPFEGFYQKDEEGYRWSRLKDSYPTDIDKVLKSKLTDLYKEKKNPNYQTLLDYIMVTSYTKFDNLALLTRSMEKIDKIVENNSIYLGDIYDYILSKLPPNPDLGQYITPRHIVNLMVELIKPKFGDKVGDICCGSAGFLIYSKRYIMKHYEKELLENENNKFFNEEMFYGFESDKKLSKYAKVNMFFNGVLKNNIDMKNSLDIYNEINEKITVALSNIPFNGREADDKISMLLKKTACSSNRQLLFIWQILNILKKGGRCAVIVSDGCLFKRDMKKLRKEIVLNNKLEAIISMPSGIFKVKSNKGKKSGVSTAIMIFTKTGTGGTDKVWFYDMKADGYSLDDKRNPVDENDIPDIVERFNELDKEEDRKRTDKSFFVAVEEIIENGYDLSINKYKEIVYDKVEYDEPKVILDRIKNREKEINNGIEELQSLI